MNTAPNHEETSKIARRFFELCCRGENLAAMTELYAESARHVEAMEMPGSPCKRVTEGRAALVQMAEYFHKTTTIHSASCSKPLVNGDQFICEMRLDCTSSEGPMAGQRMDMHEYCLYTVQGGKIVEGKFFYACDMG